jgi:hypothetical protein
MKGREEAALAIALGHRRHPSAQRYLVIVGSLGACLMVGAIG